MILRPLFAFLFATTTCVAAFFLKIIVSEIGVLWFVICQAAIVLSLVDIWLERQGPRIPVVAYRLRNRYWLLPLVSVALGVCVLFGPIKNLPERYGGFLIKETGDVEHRVDQLGPTQKNPLITVSVKLGEVVWVRLAEDGKYRISGQGVSGGEVDQPNREWADTILIVFDQEGHQVMTKDDPDSPEKVARFRTGEYKICYSVLGADCALEIKRTVKEFANYFISGQRRPSYGDQDGAFETKRLSKEVTIEWLGKADQDLTE